MNDSKVNANSAGHLELPKASVRRIMKINDEVSNIGADAVVLATKAAELFIIDLVEAAKGEATLGNRKTIKVDDLLSGIEKNQLKYEFLNEALVSKPQK